MPKTRLPYAPEFRRQMVELVRAGRTPEELAKEFEPTAQSIGNWVRQADRDEGLRKDGLTTSEREELSRFVARTSSCAWSERSSQKPRPGLLGRRIRYLRGLRTREATPGRLPDHHDVPSAGSVHQRVLRTAAPTAIEAGQVRRGADREDSGLAWTVAGDVWRAADPRRPGCRGATSRAQRVGRLMRDAGLAGVSRRRGVRTTLRNKEAQPAPDLVSREFSAQRLNRLWVTDIAYIPTSAGFLYLAMVLDVCSRRIVGWSMATHLRAELVLEALNMASGQRRPTQVIHHSDQGTQYTSVAFGQRCGEIGVKPSMGSVGDCFDNAIAESFFATLECELIDRRCFQTQAEARMAVFEYIEGWYNPHRRHSALGQVSPAEFERRLGARLIDQIGPPGSQNAGEVDRGTRYEPQGPDHLPILWKSPPLPPHPHHPGRRPAGAWKAPPLPSPGTLPPPLEIAARFPQPSGHGDGASGL